MMVNYRFTVEKMLRMYRKGEGTTLEGAVRDTLTELMYIVDDNGLDFASIFNEAEEVYREEVELDESAGV